MAEAEVNKTTVTRCLRVIKHLLSFRSQWQIELAHHSFIRPWNGPYILELTFITMEDGQDASVEWFTFTSIHSLEHRLQSVWHNLYRYFGRHNENFQRIQFRGSLMFSDSSSDNSDSNTDDSSEAEDDSDQGDEEDNYWGEENIKDDNEDNNGVTMIQCKKHTKKVLSKKLCNYRIQENINM